jgi:membrane-anchored protein YejM (alkaline phosphatase superfamily)
MQSYEAAIHLMERRDAFDIGQEPEKVQEQYGKFDLGRHCLLARRLLERGATFVQVSHSNYDTHNENFNFHIEQMGEFDHAFSTIIQDLHERGMLESTLLIVFSEFGRTPHINQYYGRDHWSKAWSIVLGGCGVQTGGAFGTTNDHGTEVVEHQVDHAQLFHTYLQAVGLDSTNSFNIEGRQLPYADPSSSPIQEILV